MRLFVLHREGHGDSQNEHMVILAESADDARVLAEEAEAGDQYPVKPDEWRTAAVAEEIAMDAPRVVHVDFYPG